MPSKLILNFSDLYVSPTFKLVMASVEKILFKRMLNIKRLKPKCAKFCDKLLNFLIKKSLDVIKKR